MQSQNKVSKAEQTRAHIITTALELFARKGFEKTTMRLIASTAGLSLGASYYYFGSKEELVLAYYQQSADAAAKANSELIAQTTDFNKRFVAILNYKFEQLSSHRALVKILARHGADFRHPLSPFSKETLHIRNSAIELISDATVGSNLKAHKILKPYLPGLFWLYQMGLILFWANDMSKDQKKTQELISVSLNMLTKLLKLSSLPIFSPVNKMLTKLIKIVLSGLDIESNELKEGA